MRAVALRLILALCLLTSQLGGAAHALSHLKPHTPDQGTPYQHHCLSCDAYGVLDQGVPGNPSYSPPPQTGPAPAVYSGVGIVAVASPCGNRDPPVV